MRKVLIIAGGVLLGLLIIFLVGPRSQVDTTLRPVDLPADLDAYLAAEEAVYDDMVPGAEKQIVWAGEPGEKTAVSLVYLHGFGATRQETAPLSDQIAAELGANLYYTRLTGHGRSGAALAEATANDWLNDAHEAVAIGQQIGEKVIVIGVSTGATLAAWLATRPESAAALYAIVLLSPNFGPSDPTSELLNWPWAQQLLPAVFGETYSWEPVNEAQARYWTESHPSSVLFPMMALVKFTRERDLAAIETPALFVYSPNDTVINLDRVEQAYGAFGSASKNQFLVTVAYGNNPSSHVLAGDIMGPEATDLIAAEILDFVNGLP